ncbi:unnamed protein product [Chrysoparadoxa australica]
MAGGHAIFVATSLLSLFSPVYGLTPAIGGGKLLPLRDLRPSMHRMQPRNGLCISKGQLSGRSRSSLSLSMGLVSPSVAVVSLKAMLELMVGYGVGMYSAKKGVLSPTNVAALSQIVYNIFLPSMLMVSIAKTAASNPMSTLLPIPLACWGQISAGFLAARLVNKALRIKPDSDAGREVSVNSGFGNSGILPILFATSLFRTHPDPTVLPRAIAYISFFLMAWSPTFWTLGYGLLTRKSETTASLPEEKAASTDADADRVAVPSEAVRSSIETRESKETRDTLMSHLVKCASSPAVMRVISPPVLGSISGFIIGTCRPLQWLLMEPSAPFGFAWHAFGVLAAAYTPSGVLVLAGSLANGPKGNLLSRETGFKLMAVALSRWLLLPALTALGLWGGLAAGLLPNDPVLHFVLMMCSVMPPAQNSVIILQVAGMREAAGRMAQTLCLAYSIGIIPVVVWLSVIMTALKLL